MLLWIFQLPWQLSQTSRSVKDSCEWSLTECSLHLNDILCLQFILTCHIGLVAKNVTLLTTGPPMFTVTQQTPTSPQGKEEIQMSKWNKDYFFAAHSTSLLTSLESAVGHRVTSSYPHTSSVNMVASLALVSSFLNLLCSDTSGCFCTESPLPQPPVTIFFFFFVCSFCCKFSCS